jgi:hypothetical protein
VVPLRQVGDEERQGADGVHPTGHSVAVNDGGEDREVRNRCDGESDAADEIENAVCKSPRKAVVDRRRSVDFVGSLAVVIGIVALLHRI